MAGRSGSGRGTKGSNAKYDPSANRPTIDPEELLRKVANDDEVRARTKQLALCVLDEAEHLILEGNPSVKVTMIRSLMPTLAKSLDKQDEVSEVDLMRQEVQHLMAAIATSVPPNNPDPNPPALEVVRDGPP